MKLGGWLCAMMLVALCAMSSGCTTLADARAAKGSGMSRAYDAPLEKVWQTTQTAVRELGLDVVGDNPAEGYILAQGRLSPLSYGENVAIFVERLPGAARTRVEVVSKKVME